MVSLMKKERLDLGYGNPGFLQKLWSDDELPTPKTRSTKNMPYLLGETILPELESNIRKIHKKYKNCVVNKKSHIVITVGAVQAVQAAMYALKETGKQNILRAPKPYWGRFESFAANDPGYVPKVFPSVSKPKEAMAKELGANIVDLVTTPNNPDGELNNKIKADIRDACYNWPQYTEKVTMLNDNIVIFSLSKLSGHSSTRIGWAVVKDKEVANKMQEYVELFSSGVSIEAQEYAGEVLGSLLQNDQFFKLGRLKLKRRHQTVKHIIKENKLPIKVLSKRGMFLYIECRPQIIYDLHITCFAGSNFGEGISNQKYRLNIGTDAKTFHLFTLRLKELKTKF